LDPPPKYPSASVPATDIIANMTKPKGEYTPERGRSEHGHFAKGNKFTTGRPPGARSKIYTAPFLDDDLRLAPARRFRGLVHRMATDLGGVEVLSAGEQQLVRRCAMISTECERMEREALDGGVLDATVYGTLTGHLTRALRVLGLKRQPRDVTPTLSNYLEATREPAEEDDQ
jgi:hypothetical protein